MRSFLAAALALSFVATAADSAHARQPKPQKVSSQSTPTADGSSDPTADPAPSTSGTPSRKVPKKKAAKGTKQPAPKPITDAVKTSDADLSKPSPLQPDPGPAAATPAASPTSSTTTTSASLRSPDAPEADHPHDKLKDDVMPPFALAPLVGLGTNGYGLGAGLRAGYTIPQKVYIGASFVYQFGTEPIPGWKWSAFYPSAEVGYDIHPVKGLIVRPYGGVGVMFATATIADSYFGGSLTGHSSSPLVYPGCAMTYTIPKTNAFVGGDVRLLLVTSIPDRNSLGLFASGGVRF